MTKSSCHKIVKLDKMPVEIAKHGNDSPGGSLKLLNLGADTESTESRSRKRERQGATLAASTKLPDPWLFDSEALLREIARCRETVLQVPITNPNATHFGLQLAISALWNLEENIRYLLRLHRDGQRSFRKTSEGRDTKHQTIYALSSWVLASCA